MQIIDYYNIQLYRDPILFIPQSKATPQFSSIPLRAPLPISRIIALGGDPEKEKQSNAREIRRHLIRIIAARCPFGIPRAVFPITRENFLISNYLPPPLCWNFAGLSSEQITAISSFFGLISSAERNIIARSHLRRRRRRRTSKYTYPMKEKGRGLLRRVVIFLPA